jgi:hypothetical protein
MPVNLIIRNPLDWDALAIARNANGANRRELSDYVRRLKSLGVWNDLGFFRDFANAKSLNHSFGPNITFTRASIATYFDAGGTLRTAAANEPRFDHDPATGASLGLLLENFGTNFLLHSADLADAVWTKSNITATANNAVAPDGTTTAAKLAATNNDGYVLQAAATTLGTNAVGTASIFLKRASGTGVIALELGESTQTCAVDSTWKRFSLTPTSITASATIASNVVTVTRTAHKLLTGDRIRVLTGSGNLIANLPVTSITVTDANTFTFAHTQADGTGNIAYVSRTPRIKLATSGDEIWAWGGQLETSIYLTSYIPTTTATATRAVESAVVNPINSFFNTAEGTIFGEGASLTPLAENILVRFRKGNDEVTGSLSFEATAGGTSPRFAVAGTFGSATTVLGSRIANTNFVKMVGAYNTATIIGALGGTISTEQAAGQIYVGDTTATHMFLARAFTNSNQFNTHIKKLAYWPKRLTNTLLEQLTT